MDKPDVATDTFPVVGVGASAGGLGALTALLEALPGNTGLAFVIVQHLDPTHQSMLPDLLARSTRLRVQEVSDGMRLEPNTVYVMPANAGLTLSQHAFQLTPREASATQRMPIDVFLRSLAQSRKNGAIAVILSGSGSDGSLGLEAIKAEGGIAFAQSETSAQFPDESIDLLLTDIVMPEMGGRELVEQASALYPNMKALFMSGYTDDALVREGIKVRGTSFLQKPFTLQELARTVRKVLDSKVSES